MLLSKRLTCAPEATRPRRFRPRKSSHVQVVASAVAKEGDCVDINYSLYLDSGEIVATTKEKEPVTFTIGSGEMMKAFDMAVTGLSVGETKKIRVDAADAYGERDPSASIDVPNGPGLSALKPSDVVQLASGQLATIGKVSPDKISLDLNHRLAGQAITVEVELLKLMEAGRVQKIYFAAGCFWGVELHFQRIPGVLKTEVGYSNGTVPNPSYDDVCTGKTGHAEVVEVVFDSAEIPLPDLLNTFWEMVDPTVADRVGDDVGNQYRSGIYYTTPEQKEVVEKSLEKIKAQYKEPILTEIGEVKMYSAAEDEHQKYLAKGGRFGKPQSYAKGCKEPVRCYG